MRAQVKIESKECSLILNCDFQDYDQFVWFLETAWNNDYDTYIRRLEQYESDK